MLEAAGWQVIGEPADGQEAVELAAELEPDLAILDIYMPVKNGLADGSQARV